MSTTGKALLCAAVVSGLGIATTAQAGVSPNIGISLQVSNGFNQMASPIGTPTGGDVYNFQGSLGDSDFALDYDFDADALVSDPDGAFLGSGFTLENLSDQTLEFTLTMTMDLANSAGPMPDYGGSSSFTITGFDGMLSSLGGPIWTAYADGNEVGNGFGDPYTLATPVGGGSNSDSANVFGQLPSPVNNTLTVSYHFSLTGNTLLTHTGSFGVIPAPGAFALLGVAGLAARRRRRG